MRIVYCHACGAVSTNTWAERDICTRCGKSAEPMEFHRPWEYYASGAILLAATALFIWGPIEDLVVRAVILMGVLAVAVYLSTSGLRRIRKQVLQRVAARSASGEAKP